MTATDAPSEGAGFGRYRPYPAYKDSGVEWLGDIPAIWEVKRLKWSITACQNGVWGDEPTGENDVPCVRVSDFDRIRFRVDISNPTLRSIDTRVRHTRMLESGNLLLEKSGGGENQPVGAVMLYDHDLAAVCSNFIARMPVADNVSTRFLTYLHAMLYAARVNVRSIKQNTGIQNLDSQSYLAELVAFPDLGNQRTTADFLDRKTAAIDALIAKKKRLIELLEEKRAALITQAVTKGLDPTVPMKESGVEWLGEIPTHWEVKKLKWISPIITVGIVVNPSTYVTDMGVPFLYGSDIKEGNIMAEGARRMSSDWNKILYKSRLQKGDLVTVRVGDPGVTAVVTKELESSNCASLLIIRKSKTFFSPWLCFTMNSRVVRHQVELVQYGAAQKQFNVAHAVDFVIPLPQYEEQKAIAMFLNQHLGIIDRLVTDIQNGIFRLKEYRTALISAAVTGKIDVRQI